MGRFRISVTAEIKPTLAPSLPPQLAEILALPKDRRTTAQQSELAGHYLRETLTRDLAAVPSPQLVYALSPKFEPDGSHKPIASPRTVHLLRRGDIRSPGPVVQPGALHCFANLPGELPLKAGASEGDRRAALAQWLTDRRNPLVWRSLVNRVWQSHFGRGIVDTPNDFGLMGGKPSHPELLDYLAVWFRDVANGSIKKLHKLMVMTATYRQSSSHNPSAAEIDQDNRLLWRMPRTRLDAEQVRDAVLLVSGRLDRRRGGPSDQQFGMKPGIHVTPLVDYGAFNWDRPEGHRRSVYRFLFRTLPDPLVECLDGADASQLTPTRNSSVTAPQSLALLNNEFLLVHAKAMAKSLKNEANPITTATHRLWGRAPTPIEQQELSAYTRKHGLENACRLLFNTNEFLFLD